MHRLQGTAMIPLILSKGCLHLRKPASSLFIRLKSTAMGWGAHLTAFRVSRPVHSPPPPRRYGLCPSAYTEFHSCCSMFSTSLFSSLLSSPLPSPLFPSHLVSFPLYVLFSAFTCTGNVHWPLSPTSNYWAI